MKVVLFCGGLGTRFREYSETIPKSMVDIGNRPIIWHLMKYYAFYGHTEFILCLGYKGDYIKNYFLHYDECLSNDFVLSKGGRDVRLLGCDIEDWTITFVETGLHSNIGSRLRAVERYLDGEDAFMANYSDGLSNLPLPEYLQHFEQSDRIASFVAVRPSQSFHVVSIGDGNLVANIRPVFDSDVRINGGFFVFRREIFQYIHEGEELVNEPFSRLIEEKQLVAYPHDGFWACMDTFKEKQALDDLYTSGRMPWAVWRKQPGKQFQETSCLAVPDQVPHFKDRQMIPSYQRKIAG